LTKERKGVNWKGGGLFSGVLKEKGGGEALSRVDKKRKNEAGVSKRKEGEWKKPIVPVGEPKWNGTKNYAKEKTWKSGQEQTWNRGAGGSGKKSALLNTPSWKKGSPCGGGPSLLQVGLLRPEEFKDRNVGKFSKERRKENRLHAWKKEGLLRKGGKKNPTPLFFWVWVTKKSREGRKSRKEGSRKAAENYSCVKEGEHAGRREEVMRELCRGPSAGELERLVGRRRFQRGNPQKV